MQNGSLNTVIISWWVRSLCSPSKIKNSFLFHCLCLWKDDLLLKPGEQRVAVPLQEAPSSIPAVRLVMLTQQQAIILQQGSHSTTHKYLLKSVMSSREQIRKPACWFSWLGQGKNSAVHSHLSGFYKSQIVTWKRALYLHHELYFTHSLWALGMVSGDMERCFTGIGI